MNAESPLIAAAQRSLLPVYRQRKMILERGLGSRVWDQDGRDYVDFTAGIAVSALGHADPDILEALTHQAGKLWHTSNVYYSEPPIRLAQELLGASGFAERVFFCNSGAEANEAAIKLVRKHAADRGRPPERRVILTFEGAFHGRTLATVTATAQPKYQQGFEPLPAGFRHAAFNDTGALDHVLRDDVAGVLVEPIQGEGGVVSADAAFLHELRRRCNALGALLVFDEIQCGMGRTGRLWAHQWPQVIPDVMTLAKGLGCGFPIGAMLVGTSAAQAMQFGSHGTTFGGNPLGAAVARVALRKLSSPDLLANVQRQSAALRSGLEKLGAESGAIKLVRGSGLMLGAVLAPAFETRVDEILDAAAREGLLLLQAGAGVLRFVPALNIGEDDIAEGLARLGRAIRQLV
ncbi:aspartate aminotransferase family protein [Dokdonella sp.]|uniref:aspartate aminotransferase family protein n=1 Tax=Dokdonella sp. TaxID=2291710 RepID=UPI003528703C